MRHGGSKVSIYETRGESEYRRYSEEDFFASSPSANLAGILEEGHAGCDVCFTTFFCL